MSKKREYLVTQYARNGDIIRQINVPKSANPKLLLERLICRELDDETIVASCLRKNAKRAYDPFKIIDMRDDIRRDQAKAALSADPDTSNPIGIYNDAWSAAISLGKVLMVAGLDHDFFLKEVEV